MENPKKSNKRAGPNKRAGWKNQKCDKYRTWILLCKYIHYNAKMRTVLYAFSLAICMRFFTLLRAFALIALNLPNCGVKSSDVEDECLSITAWMSSRNAQSAFVSSSVASCERVEVDGRSS